MGKKTEEEKLVDNIVRRLDILDKKLVRVKNALEDLYDAVENIQADVMDYKGVKELTPVKEKKR